MNHEYIESLVAAVQARAAALVAAPEVLSLVAHLDDLPAAVAELTSQLRDPSFSKPECYRLHRAARESLLHLQRALIYVQSRLQYEHHSLLSELRELAAQHEWAERSSQIT